MASLRIDYPFPNMTTEFKSSQQPFDQSFIEGFYNAARDLLDGIFPNYDDVNSGYSINLDNFLDFSDLDVDKLLWDNKGPITFILVAGILSTILTLVGIGWCVKRCCCRDRGCFCERTFDPDVMTQKKTKLWKKITATVFLLFLALLFLYGLVCCFVTNQAMRQNTKKFSNQVYHAVDDARLYLDHTTQQIDTLLKDNYELLVQNLEASGKSIQKIVTEVTLKDQQSLYMTETVLHDIKNIDIGLTKAGDTLKKIGLKRPQLKSSLNGFLQTVTQNDLLTKCDSNGCIKIREMLANLSTALDKGLGQFPVSETAMTYNVNLLRQEMNDLNNQIKSDTPIQFDAPLLAIDDAIKFTRTYLISTAKSLTDALDSVPLDVVEDDLNMVDDDLDFFMEIWHDCMILVCVVLLCIFGLMTTGLLFGIWGTNPTGHDDEISSKATGTPLINFGIFFIFLTIWGTSCVALAHFVGAGTVGQVVCEAMHNLENVTGTRNLVENKMAPKSNYQVPPYSTILVDCKANQGAYTAFHLVDAFDINELLNLSDPFKVKILENSKDIKNNHFPQIEMIQNQNTAQLAEQLFTELQSLFDEFNGLKVTAKKGNENETELMRQFYFPANQVLESIQPMLDDLWTLKKQMEVVSNDRKSLVKKIQNVTKAKEYLKTSLNGVERTLAEDVVTLVNDYAKFTVQMLDERVGECGPVYKAFESTLDAVCIHVVEPVAGFWFSLSIVILLLIPYLIAGWAVATQYSTKYKRGGCRKCCICF